MAVAHLSLGQVAVHWNGGAVNTEFKFDVLLSHSALDNLRVRRLAQRLRSAGLRVWFDEWCIQPGDDIYLEFERGLDRSRALVLCLSPAALISDWARLERSTLPFCDPTNVGRFLIPVILENCKLPDNLLQHRYVDYRKDTKFAFGHLLGAVRRTLLKATSPDFLDSGKHRAKRAKKEKQHRVKTTSRASNGILENKRLLLKLRGHTAPIEALAWSHDGRILASSSRDGTIRLWDAETGRCLHALGNRTASFRCVAFSPVISSAQIAGANEDGSVFLWDVHTGRTLWSVSERDGNILAIAWSPDGKFLTVGGVDGAISIIEIPSGKIVETNASIGRQHWTFSMAWSPDGSAFAFGTQDDRKSVVLYSPERRKKMWAFGAREIANYVLGICWSPQKNLIACGFQDGTIRIIDAEKGHLLRQLEWHSGMVTAVSFSNDGDFLASLSDNDEVCIWRCDVWERVDNFLERCDSSRGTTALAFHPSESVLATIGSGSTKGRLLPEVHIWKFDFSTLQKCGAGAHYVNAKVVLVGDTGVGKSGLSVVLNQQPYKETDSTAGRHVGIFDSREVPVNGGVTQTRETLLWDLAGQPGYRVIHQLHLNEVAVALVIFDARSEIDPLAGVRHWERALRLAQQRQGADAVPMKKFLVSARNDRGTVSVSKERLQSVMAEFGFDEYFETSAKEGWKIAELRAAIEQAIPWERLPEVSSSQLFADIKSFLLDVKDTGRLLAQTTQIFEEFARQLPPPETQVASRRKQFDTCIGRLENRDLIRRLTFGGYVLLQPELLDAYGSAMVNAAREEPDGLGSLAEEVALAGSFFIPKEQRVSDSGQEQLLLHATVEELVRHDLALRESADDGRYLVFPSQFNRDYEDAPEPKGKAVAITFDGPVQSLYSTLVVRLGHSGLFTTGRAEMWRNAAVFAAKSGGTCGLFLQEFMEGRGRLILFFPDDQSSAETRFHFEEFALAHAKRRALEQTVELVRFFVCIGCGDPVPETYVKRLREKGKRVFECPCGGTVSLAEPMERIHFQSKVEAMERSADRQRDFDAFVVSAKGETSTTSFQSWAGGAQVTLAIVFTDIVGSTALGEKIRDEAMNEVRRAHFVRGRILIEQFEGRAIKTIGDSFMVAFKNACAALDYARAFQADTGHRQVRIRAGIHIGPMHVEEGDVFGGTVNFAARVVGAIQGAEIWLSDRAKEDVDRVGAAQHRSLAWQRHEGVAMKGFTGKWTLWAVGT